MTNMAISFWLFLCLAAVATSHRLVKRQAVPSDQLLWAKKTIPFRFIDNFTLAEKQVVRAAAKEWEKYTCVKITEIHGNQSRISVDIVRHNATCATYVGSFGYLLPKYREIRQSMVLAPHCFHRKIVAHEFGHSIGLFHEQSREDRDKYIKIMTNNIRNATLKNFRKPEQRSFGLPYSYLSIMHYGKTIQGKLVMVASDEHFVDLIGHSNYFSFRDVQLVNTLYECDEKCKPKRKCPPGAFRNKDCRCVCPSEDYTAVDCQTGIAIDPTRVTFRTGSLLRIPSGPVLYISHDRFDWFVSKRHCRAMDGKLMDFASSKDMALLTKIYQFLNESALLWTRGNDIHSEGTFKWSRKRPVNIRKLDLPRGEPDNGQGSNEDCLAVTRRGHYNFFMDIDCGMPLRFICKLPKRGCHDRSTSCAYFNRTGQCTNRRVMALCRYTCNLCRTPMGRSVEKPPPKLTTTGYESCKKKQLNIQCPWRLKMIFIRQFLPRFGTLCIRCPPCECEKLPVYGTGTYYKESSLCCAAKHHTGRSNSAYLIREVWGAGRYNASFQHGINSTGGYIRDTQQASAFKVIA